MNKQMNGCSFHYLEKFLASGFSADAGLIWTLRKQPLLLLVIVLELCFKTTAGQERRSDADCYRCR